MFTMFARLLIDRGLAVKHRAVTSAYRVVFIVACIKFKPHQVAQDGAPVLKTNRFADAGDLARSIPEPFDLNDNVVNGRVKVSQRAAQNVATLGLG